MCAKIKVVGVQEMIQVNNEDLKEFVSRREAKQISNDELVSFGTWGGTAGQIKSWILDEDKKPDENSEMIRQEFLKFLEGRRRLLLLPPKERAEENLAYITLIYSVFIGRNLRTEPPTIKKELLEMAEKWFIENPLWSKPSLKAFRSYLENNLRRPKENWDTQIFNAMLRIFEEIELSEMQTVEFDKNKEEQYEKTADGLDYLINNSDPLF